MIKTLFRRSKINFCVAKMAAPVVIPSDKVLVAAPLSCELGEGSIFNASKGMYVTVDIYGPSKVCPTPAVYEHDYYNSGAIRCIPMPSFCGTVVPRAKGGYIVALKTGLHAVDDVEGKVDFLVNPEHERCRWNEGKASPDGRLWAGTMGVPGKVDKGVGGLYCLDLDGSIRKAVSDITISNGLAWTKDCKTMYYIDTPIRAGALRDWQQMVTSTRGRWQAIVERHPRTPPSCYHVTGNMHALHPSAVYAFDYDAATGGVSNQRIAFSIPAGTGDPDGCCIDADDNLWVAQWGGSRVVCYKPSDGSILAQVNIPAAHVSSCTFGGPTLTDLFITTAKEHLSEEERKAQPLAGHCFIVKGMDEYGFKGVPACVYQG